MHRYAHSSLTHTPTHKRTHFHIQGGGGGSGYIGGLMTSGSQFTAPGMSGLSSGRASTYNTGDSQYPSSLYIGMGGVSQSSNQLSSTGQGGNGLVIITPVTAVPTTVAHQFSNGPTSFTVPSGVTTVFVKLWGPGGAGGSRKHTHTHTRTCKHQHTYIHTHTQTRIDYDLLHRRYRVGRRSGI